MAVIGDQQKQIPGDIRGFEHIVHVRTWGPMRLLDAGKPAILPANACKSVQVTGVFGSGGACTIEGSNDNFDFFPLKDSQGYTAVLTEAGICVIDAPVAYIRPHIRSGDATTSLTATLSCDC